MAGSQGIWWHEGPHKVVALWCATYSGSNFGRKWRICHFDLILADGRYNGEVKSLWPSRVPALKSEKLYYAQKPIDVQQCVLRIKMTAE